MNLAEYAALVERRACEDGMCWAEPLMEACDHWRAEVERLRGLRSADRDEVVKAVAARLPGAVTRARADNVLRALDVAGYEVVRKLALDEGDR